MVLVMDNARCHHVVLPKSLFPEYPPLLGLLFLPIYSLPLILTT